MLKPLAGTALVLALAVAGCSSPQPSAPAPAPTSAAAPAPATSQSESPAARPEPTGEAAPEEVKEPRNPVELLEQAGLVGCETEARAGEVDINGNRYVTCDYMDNGGTPGTSFEVRTYPGNPAEWDLDWPIRSTDSMRFIGGDDFIASVVGDWTSYSKHLTDAELEKIAANLGGDYAKPGDELPYRG